MEGDNVSVDVAYLRIKRLIECDEECFLCALEDELETKYMDTYLSELVMDASSREKIIKSRGFCNHHFYKILIAASKPGSPDGHGIALVNKSILEKLIQDLRKHKSRQVDDLRKLFPTEKCPACVHLDEFSRKYAEKVFDLLSSGNEEFLKLLKESKGFCISHLMTLLDLARVGLTSQSERVAKILMEVEEKNLQRLSSELAEYVRRQSYEFSEKDRAAVADVVLRSVEKIAGRRGIKAGVEKNE
jgi:hypothetical protein